MIDIVTISPGREMIFRIGTKARPPSLADVRSVIQPLGEAMMCLPNHDHFFAHITSYGSGLRFSRGSTRLEGVPTSLEKVVDDVTAALADPEVMLLVRIGTEDRPASGDDIRQVLDMLNGVTPEGTPPGRALVTHHAIEVICGGPWRCT